MKKRIGIMSMQRIINYGSFLQAYGLKKLIEDNTNSDVEFIDYKYGDAIVENHNNELSILAKVINNKSVVSYIKKKRFLKEVAIQYKNDLRKIGVADRNDNKELDCLVIGSDEVFNCLQPYPVGFSLDLFGKGFECKKISYAASFGHTCYEDLKLFHVDDTLSELLKDFYSISVRDNNSKVTVKSLIGKNPVINVDPVMAYPFETEVNQYKTNMHNYIIVYAYTNRFNSQEVKIIKELARKYNKKIVSIGYYHSFADENIICNPLFVFSYFKNSDFVITDTFHGTVFSLKMNAKFCTIIRESNRNKLESLLHQFKQSDKIINNLDEIEKVYLTDTDFAITNSIIAAERKKAIDYLKENIDG